MSSSEISNLGLVLWLSTLSHCPTVLKSHNTALVQVPAAPFPIQLLANVRGKTVEDALSSWILALTWYTWKEFLALSSAWSRYNWHGHGGVSQWMQGFSVCLSLSDSAVQPCTHKEDFNQVSASGGHLQSEPAVGRSVSPSLCNSAFQVKMNKSF